MSGEEFIPRLDRDDAETWLRRDIYAIGAPDTIRRILLERFAVLVVVQAGWPVAQ